MKNNPILFVPGFKGSEIFSRTTQKKRKCLWSRTHHCFLSSGQLDYNSEQDFLEIGNVIKKITLFPLFWEKDIYYSWSNFLNILNRPISFFPYDWRRSPRETAQSLSEFAKNVVQQFGQPLTLIGHSLGGLLARWSSINFPYLFKEIIYVGTPFSGGIGLLPDFHFGTRIGINSKILSKETYFTFPSSYSFFPLQQGPNEHGHILGPRGENLDMDFFNADHWGKHNLGIFQNPQNHTTKKIQQLTQLLHQAKTFRQELKIEQDFSLKTTIIQGTAHSTLAQWKKKNSRWQSLYAQGDGRFLTSDQESLRGEKQIIKTHLHHSKLMNCPELWAYLLKNNS